MKTIQLGYGPWETRLDDEDYERYCSYFWQVTSGKKRYCVRKEEGKILWLHREIMGSPEGRIVDHRDGDGLNNQRSNLRVVTAAQNTFNTRKQSRQTSSCFKGTYYNTSKGKWLARLVFEGVSYNLGAFDEEKSAAEAYDDAAHHHFGEFACLNFPERAPKPYVKRVFKRKSEYPGVTWDNSKGKWRAYVLLEGKVKWLGRFETEEDAARAAKR